MSFNASAPPPMTDPLGMDKSVSNDDIQSLAENDEIERQQAAMERGMPARNLKKVAVITLAIAAGAYMTYPTLFPEKKAVVPVVVEKQSENDKNSAGSIIAQLKNQQPAKPPEVPVEAPKPKEVLSAQQGGTNNQTVDPMLTAAELELTRKASITASPMEPQDFAIPARESANAKSANATQNDPQSALAKSISEQNSILAKAMGGPGDTNAATKSPANPQSRKSVEDEFVLKTRIAEIEEPTRLAPARQKAALYQGTIIQVILDRAINTDNPGTARGRVRSDVYDSVNQSMLLIPRGSVIMLPYLNSVLVGQSRILVAGERLIFPNGKSVSLSGAVAGDMQGASGIPAEVDNHFYEMFKASFIVGAASLILPKNQQQVTVSESANGSRQTGGTVLAQTFSETLQRITERNTAIKPTASIEVGESFTLMLAKDMELEPYLGRK